MIIIITSKNDSLFQLKKLRYCILRIILVRSFFYIIQKSKFFTCSFAKQVFHFSMFSSCPMLFCIQCYFHRILKFVEPLLKQVSGNLRFVFSAGIYLLKVNNRDTRTTPQCSHHIETSQSICRKSFLNIKLVKRTYQE